MSMNEDALFEELAQRLKNYECDGQLSLFPEKNKKNSTGSGSETPEQVEYALESLEYESAGQIKLSDLFDI